jgi:methyl-accepting chemotaxis protein
MNQSQIDQVKGHIDNYFSIDLSGLLASTYAESTDLNDVKIGEYSAKEFLSMSNKVFSQFREELNTSYIKALPFQYNFHNEYGNANLHQDLSSYLAQVNANNFPAAIVHLNRLTHYQAINGFWEKSKRKYFKASESSLLEEKERVDLASKHIQKVSEDLNRFIEEIGLQKEDLSNFTLTKKKELTEIESLLAASRQCNSEITNLNTSAITLVEKINSLLEATDEKKEESEKLLLEARNSSKELLEIIKSYSADIEKQNKNYSKLEASFNEKLQFVEDKKEYFEERNQYLDDLIGREVGASLFETFKQRKKELEPSGVFQGSCHLLLSI